MVDLLNLGTAGPAVDAVPAGDLVYLENGAWFPGDPSSIMRTTDGPVLIDDSAGVVEFVWRAQVPEHTAQIVASTGNNQLGPEGGWHIQQSGGGQYQLRVSDGTVERTFGLVSSGNNPVDVTKWFRAVCTDNGDGTWTFVGFDHPDRRNKPSFGWTERISTTEAIDPKWNSDTIDILRIGGKAAGSILEWTGIIGRVLVLDSSPTGIAFDLEPIDDYLIAGATSFRTSDDRNMDVFRTPVGPTLTMAPDGQPVYVNAGVTGSDSLRYSNAQHSVAVDEDFVTIWVGQGGNESGSFGDATNAGITGSDNTIRMFTSSNQTAQRLRTNDGSGNLDTQTRQFLPDVAVVLVGVLNRSTGLQTSKAYDASGVLIIDESVDASAVGALIPDGSFGNFMRLRNGSFRAAAWNKGVGIAPTDDDLADLAKQLLVTETSVEALYSYIGYWQTGQIARRVGCAISDGHNLLVEMFYNPDTTARRYGFGQYGEFQYGGYGAPQVLEARWVDATRLASNMLIERGLQEPSIEVPTDEVTVDMRDLLGTLFGWKGEDSLNSPTLNTPLRIQIQDRAGALFPHSTCRIDTINEHHADGNRQIVFEALGTHSELVTSLFKVNRPRETIAQRIDFVLAAVGWQNGVDPYPPEFLTVNLENDDFVGDGPNDFRQGNDALAYTIAQQAAASAGFTLISGHAGELRFVPFLLGIGSPIFVFGDEFGPNVDAVCSEIQYTADTSHLANVIQLINQPLPAESVEASDPSSIAIWGRRANARGFPLSIANRDEFDSQAVADAYLAAAAFDVNRVAWFRFHTLVDSRWWDVLSGLEIGDHVLVQRANPSKFETFDSLILGSTIEFGENFADGVVYLSTNDPTL